MPEGFPPSATELIGRKDEVATLRAMLEAEGARLLTLTGPGGSGKTRLAVAAATDLAGAFPGGVFFVDLSPLRDPALVLPTVAGVVGARESADVPPAEALARSLGERSVLLVLDNCEQVVDAAPDVAGLLDACPGVAALATSREPLRVWRERVFPVPPLALPEGTTPQAVAAAPATALFVERARAVRPDFALTPENAAAVAEICRRLDGLPLAIELAAARVALLPPAALATRLDRALEVLTAGPRDAPARHRTLRAAIAWSHEMLGPEEQPLFRRLAVFAGGCSLEDVEAVCGDGLDVLAALGGLVAKSLLRQEDAAGEARFRMLETVREYALDRLRESGEEGALRGRHAGYFATLAERAESGVLGPAQVAWQARLARENDNLRAALGWSLDGGDAEVGLRIAAALKMFWRVQGQLREARTWLAAALARGAQAPAALRARVLDDAGSFASAQGDYERARAHQEEALALRRGVADEDQIAASLQSLGALLIRAGDYRAAAAALEEALALRRATGESHGLALVLMGRGQVATLLGDPERAEATLHEALGLFDTLGDRRRVARCHHYLAGAALAKGALAEAAAHAAAGLAGFRGVGYRLGMTECLETAARVLLARGQAPVAVFASAAADAARTDMALARNAPESEEHADMVASGRRRLGEAGFTAAWERGAPTPLEGAAEHALDALRATVPAEPGRAPERGPAGSLSAREREVAGLVARGMTNRQIAEELVISERTAESHVSSVLGKLELANRAQLTAWAIEHGLGDR